MTTPPATSRTLTPFVVRSETPKDNVQNHTQHFGDRLCVEVRGVARDSFVEYHVTATVLKEQSSHEAAAECFEAVAATLARLSIRTLQEKIFGLTAIRDAVLRQREEFYRAQELDLTVPFTWIMGTPLRGCDFVGVQIWGFSLHSSNVQLGTVTSSHGRRGRELRGPDFRLLYVPFLRGASASGLLEGDGAVQTDRMFCAAEETLGDFGLGYDKVVRTWLYYSHLLDWYPDLNRIRTQHYKAFGFGQPGRPAFPASTGIQGRSDTEECMMDLLAVDVPAGKTPVATPVIHSPRQEQSFNYGSAFSRAMLFTLEGRRTLSISGTASINAAGATIHVGNAELQCLETLLCVSALLEQQGGRLENIAAATLYCKDRGVWEAWKRVSRLLSVPEIPLVCMIADVCRDDLLVEMEAFATF